MSTATPFDLDRIGGPKGLRAIVDRVVRAGDLARHLYDKGVANRLVIKDDRSPLTEADEAVESALREFIQKTYPDAAFLGEETGSSGGEESGIRFIVDPIDGTRAFIRGLPTWSVLVGVEADGVPACGIVYMPAHQDLFVAVRGSGAECNGRPIRVSEVSDLSRALVMHGGLEQFQSDEHRAALFRVADASWTMRGFSDFEGYRQLLLGRADAMIDPGVQPWDICAAKVLVEEAGGRLTSMSGKDTIFERSALATNGQVHAAVLSLLND